MPKKKFDLAVVTGKYTDQTGQSKNRYQNIGVVIQADDGGHYMLIDPLINLAAVPREPGKDRIMVSMFEPKVEGAQSAPQQRAPQQRQAAPADDFDSVPF